MRKRGWACLFGFGSPPPRVLTSPCFFLSLFQYFYLLFSPNDALPLTGDAGWVLNTEAHPLRRLPSSAVTALTVDFVAPPKPAAGAAAAVKPAAGAGAGAGAGVAGASGTA